MGNRVMRCGGVGRERLKWCGRVGKMGGRRSSSNGRGKVERGNKYSVELMCKMGCVYDGFEF